MGKYIAKRLLFLIPILFGVSFIIFTIMNMIPGDVASLILGDNAPQSAREEIIQELGLNKPFWVRYFDYVFNALHGDFGLSYRTRTPVWQKGSKILLEANEDYYKGAPSIKNIELRVLKETTTSMVALESGDVDVVYNIGGLDTLAVQANEDLGYQETEGTSIWNLGFNVNQAPFDNADVRRALAMAVNREDIINGAMDGAGTPAEIILPAQTLPNPGADAIDTPKYDPEGAKALLAEAGYPNGFDTTIYVREDYTKKIASIIQSQWKEIGVNAEIQVMERAALMSDIKAGKLSCYTIGNVSMTLDSSFLLGTLTTVNIPDSNMTFYSNPEYDAIVEQQTLTDDPDERLDLITQALQIEARDVPRINLFYMVSNIAYNKDLNCKLCAGLESYNWSEFSWN